MSAWGFRFYGTLPTLNEYLAAARHHTRTYHPDNQMKQEWTRIVLGAINLQPRPSCTPYQRPVHISYTYHEPNRRRDHDNVAAVAHKFVQDALVAAGILAGDGWRYVSGFDDEFCLDRAHPHIDVLLTDADTDAGGETYSTDSREGARPGHTKPTDVK